MPEWYDAGKVAIENSFAPWGEMGAASVDTKMLKKPFHE